VQYLSAASWQKGSDGAPSPALVFHLDTRDATRWRLRLVFEGRAWRRSIEGGLFRDRAAIEAAALMAARTSIALLMGSGGEQDPEALKAWAREAAPQQSGRKVAEAQASRLAPVAASPRPSEDRRQSLPTGAGAGEWRAAVLAAYRGSSYAPERPWVHAARAGLVLLGSSGPMASLAYVYTAPATITSDFGSFEIARQQGELLLGWRFRFGPLVMSPKIGAAVDATHRSEATPRAGVGSSLGQRWFDAALVTAFELEWPFAERLAVVTSLGALYYATDRQFFAAGVAEPLLAPHSVRLTLDLGMTLRLF
jgi:hypothetical protein